MRRSLLVLTTLILTVIIIYGINERLKTNKQFLGTDTQKNVYEAPIRLKIPSINVDAVVEHVGLTIKGEMDVPKSTMNAGWFEFGPRPGDIGSAVIAGHFNGKNGEVGVFADLDKLKKGDKIYVEDDTGKTLTFGVGESRTYDPGYADEVFNLSDSSHLNLITCDGIWDETKKSYSKRLVIFADLL